MPEATAPVDYGRLTVAHYSAHPGQSPSPAAVHDGALDAAAVIPAAELPVYVISDVHVDFQENLAWVEDTLVDHGPNSVVVVAGDCTDDLALLRRCLIAFRAKFGTVFYVVGNHELWIRCPGVEPADSFSKFDVIVALCRELGVLTEPAWVADYRCLIVPLPSWYDGTLHQYAPWESPGPHVDHALECWNDTKWCNWGIGIGRATSAELLGRVVSRFHEYAEHNLAVAQELVARRSELCAPGSAPIVVVSFSHFYSNRQQLMPLMEAARTIQPSASGRYPPNFTSVAGTTRLQTFIDRLDPSVHVCGHSHRPFDFVVASAGSDDDASSPAVGHERARKHGCRYVHFPLGYPGERERGLAPVAQPSPLRLF